MNTPFYQQILVGLVLFFLIISLYWKIIRPLITFVISVIILGLFGIISSEEILKGFSNEQIIVIILLIVIGHLIQKASLIEPIFNLIFQRAKTYTGFLTRLMLYISSASAFFNNTPLVAILMPYISSWSKKNNVSKSKLLIPLSFAAILGGSATLVGTSTNLIVNGMYYEETGINLSIFEFSYVGVPMILLGFLYMRFWGHKLLPEKKDALTKFAESTRQYLVEANISEHADIIGQTIEEAQLRNLKGLFLIEIIRKDEIIQAKSNTKLQYGDKLIFAGDTEKIIDLIQNHVGIILPETNGFDENITTNIIEVIVAPNSSLINSKIKDIEFRGRYAAGVIAIHRNGEKLTGKIGSINLQAGDVLLIIKTKDFNIKSSWQNDFYQISAVTEIKKYKLWHRFLLLGGLIAVIILSALELITLFKGLITLIALILVFKLVSLSELKQSLDLNLLTIAALALAIGKALINSGLADNIAGILIDIFLPFGVVATLFGVFIITNIIASYMTNITAISIMFPISYSIGNELLLNNQIEILTPFILIVAYAASANYITPVGYLTNIMVYGSGAYDFKDFFRVGFPLLVIHTFTAVFVISFVYNIL